MSSYTDHDSDASRLPEGFTRTGYDANTETYTYTSRQGESYSGLPGNRYGRLYPTGSVAHRNASDRDDPWAHEIHRKGWLKSEEWRYLAPFLFIVGLVLVSLVWWMRGGDSAHYRCATGEITKRVKHGDTCWATAKEYNVEVAQLKGPYTDGGQPTTRLALDCEKLGIGDLICVPRSA